MASDQPFLGTPVVIVFLSTITLPHDFHRFHERSHVGHLHALFCCPVIVARCVWQILRGCICLRCFANILRDHFRFIEQVFCARSDLRKLRRIAGQPVHRKRRDGHGECHSQCQPSVLHTQFLLFTLLFDKMHSYLLSHHIIRPFLHPYFSLA